MFRGQGCDFYPVQYLEIAVLHRIRKKYMHSNAKK